MLARSPARPLTVLVVWEPILWSDWAPPTRGALARIADRRARQFWDPGHLVSRALSRAASRQPGLPEPSCCLSRGFYWDEAILYPPGPRWQQAPAPAFWDGAVYQIVPSLEKALGGMEETRTERRVTPIRGSARAGEGAACAPSLPSRSSSQRPRG